MHKYLSSTYILITLVNINSVYTSKFRESLDDKTTVGGAQIALRDSPEWKS